MRQSSRAPPTHLLPLLILRSCCRRNAASVAAFGYLKDLPELLHRIVHGGKSTRTPGKKARLEAEGGGFLRPGGRGRGRGRWSSGSSGWRVTGQVRWLALHAAGAADAASQREMAARS